jgi:hypothetical protein
MKVLLAISVVLLLLGGVIGCKGNSADATAGLKPFETRSAGSVTVVLLNAAGELRQGQNDFIVQFRNQQGQPIEVGDVQLGSSMAMPGMAPMSGDSQLTPAGQPGTYRVKSNFAMSGAWHFTISWKGPNGQGSTAFNSNVR